MKNLLQLLIYCWTLSYDCKWKHSNVRLCDENSYNDSTIDISKDWLQLVEDGVIINHSKMKKFGFVVGELVITIIKD